MPVDQHKDYSNFFASEEHQRPKIGDIDYRPPDVIIGFIPALFTYSKLYFLKHTMNSGGIDYPLPVEKIDFLCNNFCTPIIT